RFYISVLYIGKSPLIVFWTKTQGVIPKGIIIYKTSFFQWIRKKSPRPERPQTLLSNLRAKEAENRIATRDQAPLKGEIVVFCQSFLLCSKSSFSSTQTSLVSPSSTLFGGKPPKQKSTSGEVSLFRQGGRFVSAPPLQSSVVGSLA
ncbi:hypothetical protein AB4480_08080, partial [Vibrio sp. 10N.261.45.A4]|uniref:hypothetical protein n=1 Tax=Vibrio sp. 10N.261.45.A4 TaxID=3229655 RepID=UPI0035534255